MSFDTLDGLDDFVRRLGAEAKLAAIRATARPTLLFKREVVADDSLPVGAHKFGGHPDLPTSFVWPERLAWPDARDKADQLRREAEARRAHILEPTAGAPNPALLRVAQSRIDDLDDHYDAKIAVLFEPFPLAFVAQFDLGALAALDGLDPDLPRHGLLSLFADFTWAGFFGRHWVYWHDGPIGDLARREPPQRLIAQHDLYSHYDARPWRLSTTSERLHPTSAVTVPDHWWDWFSEGHVDQSGFEAMERDELPPRAHQPSAGHLRDVHDRLGGWPETLQLQHPEHCIARAKGGGVTMAGVTAWRNLYSNDGNSRADRVMYGSEGGGDRVYLMIREDDLKARRFEAVETVAIYD